MKEHGLAHPRIARCQRWSHDAYPLNVGIVRKGLGVCLFAYIAEVGSVSELQIDPTPPPPPTTTGILYTNRLVVGLSGWGGGWDENMIVARA